MSLPEAAAQPRRHIPVVATIVVVVLGLLVASCGVNNIPTYEETSKARWSEVQNQYQRRADLIPNLVETVKGFAKQELAVFGEVARARGGLLGAVQSKDPEQMAAANAQMTGALGRLLAVSEAYPQLKSDQGFLKLQDELAGTENRIAVSRTDYNGAVQQYNTLIKTFPTVLTAKVTGAKEKKYYQVANAGNREAPSVNMGDVGAPGTPAAPPASTAPAKP